MLEGVQPAPWEERLAQALIKDEERDWQDRLRDLKSAPEESNATVKPDEHRALMNEFYRIFQQRPDTKEKSAS